MTGVRRTALAAALPARLSELGIGPEARAVVAVSGGRDSVALLHLLRFSSAMDPGRLRVAHFDHRMRPCSRGDADWVRGLSRAWGLQATIGRADRAPTSEAEARSARYTFLHETRAAHGAAWILTAHHADDQAETVLFRALRGTGVRGLAGIRERRAPGVARPLLPYARDEIVEYARIVGLTFREDPTNRDVGLARNRIRHQILPRIERHVAPGARTALVRLAQVMEGVDESVGALAEHAMESLTREARNRERVLDRAGLLALPESARGHVLRAAARSVGVALDHAGTRLALQVTSLGASGKSVDLGSGLILVREFDLVRIRRVAGGSEARDGASRCFRIAGPGEGSGSIVLDGRSWAVRWSASAPVDARWRERFVVEQLAFPLTIRGWRPGDRMLLSYGTKKLKKLFREARLPRTDRHRQPLVVDRNGEVVWVPAVARSHGIGTGTGSAGFRLGFQDV